MTNADRLSEALYVGLCHEIGTRKEISIRRDLEDIKQEVLDCIVPMEYMVSGSFREGFRLSTSDRDVMVWLRNEKVICDFSQAQQYRKSETNLYLMECVESRPGFVLLQNLTPSEHLLFETVRVNDLYYISSFLFMRKLSEETQIGKMKFEIHGPCLSNVIQGVSEIECDFGWCFSCDFWPPQAKSWIQRCRSWPPPPVLYEIIVSGCHFMAIGSKLSPNEDKEWRLSFSQAENKLVYAMNHSQFLVYGLLKLFLKEVINQIDQEKLLCSYFLKTAVFWEIQENNILHWRPQNIIPLFWACYKRVMKWVYKGYCPNFFVTENNMFFGKIWGSSQITLYNILHELYEKGISCLLYSKSIRSYLVNFICHPTNVVNVHERRRFFGENNVLDIYMAIRSVFICYIHLEKRQSFRFLQKINELSKTNLTQTQVFLLQINAMKVVSCIALSIQRMNIGGNKSIYKTDMSICKMLKTVACSGFVPQILFLVMYYYSTCRYARALFVLHKTEVKFMQHNLTYNGTFEKIVMNIGRQCLLDKYKYNLPAIELKKDTIYVNQLTLEQRISTGFFVLDNKVLYVPPVVLLRMLYVFCYNHVNRERRQDALNDLYTLVHYDTGTYIEEDLRDISYQILGICQEMCGDFQAAIASYNLSLECVPFNNIRKASLIRIHHAYSMLRNLF